MDGERIVKKRDERSPDPIRLGGIGAWLAERLEAIGGHECRATVLGHVQRGGSPSACGSFAGDGVWSSRDAAAGGGRGTGWWFAWGM